jgi:hypothetical protein
MTFDVPYSTLVTFHQGCNGSTNIGPNCNAAIHRFCGSKGFLSGFGPNEVGPSSETVACVPADFAEGIATTYTVLKTFHAACDGGSERAGPNCNAAIHRFCGAHGDLTGFGPVENADDGATIVCLRP